jgi:hypothetical protein
MAQRPGRTSGLEDARLGSSRLRQRPGPHPPGYNPPYPACGRQPLVGRFRPAPIVVHQRATSAPAVAALAFGVIGLLTVPCLFGLPCVMAVLFGHVGLGDTKDGRRSGRAAAVTGLVLGFVVVVPAFVLTIGFGSDVLALIAGSTGGGDPGGTPQPPP